MKNSKLLGCLSLALVACGSLVGCKKKTAAKTFTVCLASEPQSIDPALNSSVDGATLLVHLDSGLYQYVQDEEGKVVLKYDLAEEITKAPAVVKDLELETEEYDTGEKDENGKPVMASRTLGGEYKEYQNGTQYTVKLREGIKWSNGDAITADDFIYSWNRAASSKLGGDYCYMFEAICNGVACETDCEYHNNEIDKVELAMKKVDDRTFTFDVMVDNAYMDQLMAFPTYFPVHKATVERCDTEADGKWATDPSTFVSCGAYKMTEWKHNSYIKIEKNADYWDAENIACKEITFALSDDADAMYANYTNNSYQMIDDLSTSTLVKLTNEGSKDLHIEGQMGTYYVSFNINHRFKPKGGSELSEADSAKVRKALGLLINRKYIVDEIGQAGQIPANGFVSKGLSDVAGGEFIDHNGVNRDGSGYFDAGLTTEAYNANVAAAIELLKGVGYTFDANNKCTNWDEGKLEYIYNTNAGHQAIAANICDTFATYGITISSKNYDWADFLEERKQGNYVIARNGWLADYDDPSSYLTMWTTVSGNNDCQFGKGNHTDVAIYSMDLDLDGTIEANEKNLTWAQSYDFMMDKSNKEADATKRFQMLHAIEDLLMETGCVCPVYYYTDVFLIKPNIKGFFSSPLGYKFFKFCYTDKVITLD